MFVPGAADPFLAGPLLLPMAEEQRGNSKSGKSLRERAEELLRTKPAETPHLPTEDVQSLLQELQVHQAELEIQNQELREMQLRLAESRDRLSDLFEFAPIGYVTLDPHATILDANLTAAEILEVPRSELIEQPLSQFVHAESQDRLHLHLRSVFNHESTQSCEIGIRSTGDVRKYVRLDTLVIGSHEGQQFRMSLVDITARKTAETALRDSERMRRLALSSGRMGVWQWNLREKTVIGDDTLADLFGLAPSDQPIPLSAFYGKMAPDTVQKIGAMVDETAEADRDFHGEFRLASGPRAGNWIKWRGRTSAENPAVMTGVSIDVTEQKQAEAALRESEQRFRSMADDLPLIVWQHDAEGNQEFVNQTFCEFFGVNREEMRGDRWQQVMHPDDAEHYGKEFFRCVRERSAFRAEVRVKRSDGEWRWLESWGRPRFTDNGDFLGILGTSADITDRKQAEQQVKAMNAILEQRIEDRTAALSMLSEIASTANTASDVETAFVRILELVSRHNGWICGHAWVVDPEDPESLRPAYRWYSSELPHHDELRERIGAARVRRGEGIVGRVFTAGEPAFLKDIKSHFLSYQVEAADRLNICGVAAFPILAGKTVVGVLEFLSKSEIEHSEELLSALASVGTQLGRVVERQWSAQSLEEREERLRTILRTAADAVVAVNRWGGIEHVNPATERIFGFREEELIGNSISLLVASPDQDRTSGVFLLGSGRGDSDTGVRNVEIQGRRKDGSVLPVELSACQVDHSGMFTVILRDISQRKAEQARLLQAERLAAIGEAMTGLTHESRNALARSQANLNRLERRLADQPEMVELIEAIQQAQDDIARQFEEVRAYAAPLTLNRTATDLRSVIEEAWSQLSSLHERRNAKLRLTAAGSDLVCEIDELSMRDVFRNILENSLAACGDPVDIDVDFSENEGESAPALEITIRDNGPGFSAEASERAFESFFTTKTQGTGLGLSIAKRIVEAHGGDVKLISEAGNNAEVAITLPRKAE